jgi:hypothetical protein
MLSLPCDQGGDTQRLSEKKPWKKIDAALRLELGCSKATGVNLTETG